MTEHPIVLNTEEVRAVLDGRKTLDVRPVRRAVDRLSGEIAGAVHPARERGYVAWWPGNGVGLAEFTKKAYREGFMPPSEVGDVLWVKETWQDYCPMWGGSWCGHGTQEGIERDHQPVYKADPPELWIRGGNDEEPGGPPLKWRSSTQMPRWVARLFLRVTDIRVKRVQEITWAEALAAGAVRMHLDDLGQTWSTYARGFESQWDLRYAKRGLGWEKNPWVWLRTFERTDSPAGPKVRSPMTDVIRCKQCKNFSNGRKLSTIGCRVSGFVFSGERPINKCFYFEPRKHDSPAGPGTQEADRS